MARFLIYLYTVNTQCIMNKKFNAEDKIELGLHHHVAEYYYLKYRFLPKRVVNCSLKI